MSQENKGELWNCEPRMVKVADLKPYENNVRDNNQEAVDAVVESLKRHGYQERILVDENMVIIRGHTRLKAFKQLGWDEVEVLVATGWTPEQVRTVRLADNRTQELSMLKPKELDLELRELPDVEYAKTLGLEETKPFAEGKMETTKEDIEQAQKHLESLLKDQDEAKQAGMVNLKCPHCDTVFMMKIGDLKNKVKYKIKEGN